MTAQSRGNKKRGLGRGLDALIVSTAPPADEESHSHPSASLNADLDPNQTGVNDISIRLISPNPKQPRTHFDETALTELADSIREHGIIQPLILTENPDERGRYWLVAGERRWRAAKRAGLDTVPAIVRETSPQQLVEWAIIENIQRSDLNPLEEAVAYYTLMREFSFTHEQVAERVGKSRSTVTNTMRLLHLPADAQKALIVGRISAGHARALLSLPDQKMMLTLLEQIMADGLNVRQTEVAAKMLLYPEDESAVTEENDDGLDENLDEIIEEREPVGDEDHQVQRMENSFRTALGTRVNLRRKSDGSGRLVIHFYNDDDLQNIYELVAQESDS